VQLVRDQPGESVLPFFLFKLAIKCLDISIGFGNDLGSILGHNLKFDVSWHSSHYVSLFVLGMRSTNNLIIISNGVDKQLSHIVDVIVSDSQDKKHLERETLKLHVRLGHPTALR
jgi:hypothetical protein